MRKIFTFIMLMLVAASVLAAEIPTPATPSVTDWQRRGFRYELKIDVPLTDVEGNPIEKDNLSYRLYVDGKPFTFTTAEYSYIEADMTEIPWDYQDSNGYGNDIMKWYDGVSDNCRRIFLYSDAATVAVESVCRTADGEKVSARYVYDTATREGTVEEPQPAVLSTPANPTVTDWQRRGFRYELKIDVPLTDVDGNPLEKENLSYRLYVNGEPFTFTTSEYSYIEADMTEISWDYQDANGYGNDIMKWYDGVSDNCRRIFLYSDAATVAVESVYRTADGERVSARYVYDTATREGRLEEEEPPLPLLTPVNPTVTDWQRRGFKYELKIDVPATDVDGNPLSTENLSYRLYVDGEPFTFTKTDYNYIEADMTEIPWDYQDADGMGNDIMKWVDGDGSRRIYLYSQAATVAVESVYRISEGEAVSARYVYDTFTGKGHVEGAGDPSSPVLTELPEGVESRLYTLDTWMMGQFNLQHSTWSGKFDYVGVSGNDVYFRDVCAEYRFGTWIKGTVQEDGKTLRVPMYQHVFHQDENLEEGLVEADVYLQAARVNEAGDGVEILPRVEYVDFTIDEDGVISLDGSMGLAYVGDEENLLAKNLGYEYRPFDMEAAVVTPPADMEPEDYKMTFSSEPGGSRSAKAGVKVVIDTKNGEIYVKGLTKTMDAWVKGAIVGDKAVFPSAQYVGTYESYNEVDEFAVYFNGAEATDEMDLFGRVYATKENITFIYDRNAGTLKSEDSVTETIGAVNPLSHMVAPELTPVKSKEFEPATPADPSVTSWGKRGFNYELYIEVPSIDTEDNPVNTDALVYRIYVDGSDVPYVFDTEVYKYIGANMTDVLWGYQDQDGVGYDIMKWQGEDSRRIYFYEPHTLVAVESAYTAKGETRTSRRHVYNTETGTSEYIDPASVSVISGDKTVVGVTYTDIAGVEVAAPVRGIYIKTTRYADGTVKNEKVYY